MGGADARSLSILVNRGGDGRQTLIELAQRVCHGRARPFAFEAECDKIRNGVVIDVIGAGGNRDQSSQVALAIRPC
jgi:hypothetical protein